MRSSSLVIAAVIVVVAPLAHAQVAPPEAAPADESTVYVPADLSLVSPLALAPLPRKTIGGLSINIIHGEAAEMYGLQLGGIMNLTWRDAAGISVAGIWNEVGGDFTGLMVGGAAAIAGNCRGIVASFGVAGCGGEDHSGGIVVGGVVAGAGRFSGLLIGGLGTAAGRDSPFAVQLSGIGNWMDGGAGVQLSMMNNVEHDFDGLQISLANFDNRRLPVFELVGSRVEGNTRIDTYRVVDPGEVHSESHARGLVIGGLFNYAAQAGGLFVSGMANITDDLGGLALSGGANVARDVAGLQLSSLFNYARDVHGVQIGLVNIARRLYGVQIGLVNVATDNALPFMIAANAGF
jgi:hypothetical protein